MAKFIPDGWQMSPAGAQKYKQEIGRIEGIVRRRCSKYNLQSMSMEDLLQEGRLAAAYAVDSYKPDRGSFDGYIGVVVANAVAMVAAEALAQRRQSYTHVQDVAGKWVRTPVRSSELFEDAHDDPAPNPEQRLRAREEEAEASLRALDLDRELQALGLSEDARTLLRMRLTPPPELWVRARNLNRGRYRINSALIAEHLGWPRQRLQRSSQELNSMLETVL
jgi:RNA polymerase sigma factor (sigma-70 family)